MAEGQRHATRSFFALAEGVGAAGGRWCRPMGAGAGKRQRPCAHMDSPRSLDQSCLNHEFIKSKPPGNKKCSGAFQDLLPRPAKRLGNCRQERQPSAVRARSTGKYEAVPRKGADNSPRIVASAATYCAVYNCARMALTPGAKLGTYWIQCPLVAVGIGEVVRATCTLHWR